MPVRCVVGGCSNVITGKISLHRWPKDEKTRRLWTKFVQNTRADFTGPSQFSSICSEHFTEEDYDPSIALKEKMGLAAGKQKRTPLPGRIPTVKVPTRRSGMQSEGGAEEPGPDVRPSTSASSSEEAIPSPSGSGVLSQPVRKKPRLSSERRQRKEVITGPTLLRLELYH
ncbi:THAP domain-containing protein 10 [Holothuria leucospilota]|uniref:THAP domain-containing protein 10 n=1 Tax=Holothuria leucospilota TaxID=206669 RepID=A0A9Q0YCT3_HOLLE|nr:THAP domain-containing protein 10 [Holothuria leucospilota]